MVDDAIIYYVSRDDFNQACRDDDGILIYFTKLLCKELNDIEERLVSAAYEPVRSRVALALIQLSELYTCNEKGESVITLCRGDLSRMAGTAKETTIRLLSEFKKEKLIETEGAEIVIIDLGGLKRIVDLYR